MNKNQERLIDLAIDVMEKRAMDDDRNISVRCAYTNAVSMLIYAFEENEEELIKFDYRKGE